MALNEIVLPGASTVFAGSLYVVAGVVTKATTTQTVSAWAAAIGGSPVIKNCDLAQRANNPSPFAPGLDPFGT
jgi:hypothetical protein